MLPVVTHTRAVGRQIVFWLGNGGCVARPRSDPLRWGGSTQSRRRFLVASSCRRRTPCSPASRVGSMRPDAPVPLVDHLPIAVVLAIAIDPFLVSWVPVSGLSEFASCAQTPVRRPRGRSRPRTHPLGG